MHSSFVMIYSISFSRMVVRNFTDCGRRCYFSWFSRSVRISGNWIRCDRGDARNFPPMRYIRVIVERSRSPLTHRHDISKEQVFPVFWCIFEMNHRVFRVYRYKNDLRGTGFIVDWRWLHRVCYALSLNYELSDKFPESWQESEESRSLRWPKRNSSYWSAN